MISPNSIAYYDNYAVLILRHLKASVRDAFDRSYSGLYNGIGMCVDEEIVVVKRDGLEARFSREFKVKS